MIGFTSLPCSVLLKIEVIVFAICGKLNDYHYPKKEIFVYKSWNQWMYYHLWQKVLYTWDYINEIEMWRWLPWIIWWVNIIPRILIRRRRCAHRSHDWSDAAKRNEATRRWKRPGINSCLEPLERTNFADTLTLAQWNLFWTSAFQNQKRIYLYYVNHQVWGNLLQQQLETNILSLWVYIICEQECPGRFTK